MPRIVALFAACVVLAVGLPIVSRAQQLEVIDLDYRLATDLLPILQPLLDADGVLTGTDDKLFVRTSPANLEQIRQAVAALDRAPRQLLITVGQGTVRNVDTASAHGSATIGSGDVQVGVNGPPGADSGAQVVVHGQRQEAHLQNVSSVRALEGYETFVAIGQSVPVTSSQVVHGWGGTSVQRSTVYRDVNTGFYATARTSGDRVTLEISSRQQSYAATPGQVVVGGRPVSATSGTVHTRGANSIVTGRLGEWIELGAVSESDTGTNGGLLVWGRRTASSSYSAWVKVDETN
jgi:type II secretory pathway component GspD/PulD (secretin)